NLHETAISWGVDIDVDPCDGARGDDHADRHYRHISDAERDRDKAGPPRRGWNAGTKRHRDADRGRLGNAERNHENDADAVHNELVSAERVGPEQPHQDSGRSEEHTSEL